MTESEVRAWFKQIGEVILQGTSITNTAIDDKVVAMFFNTLESDVVWGLLWPFIDDIFQESPLVRADQSLVAEAEKAGIDPMTIIAIITAVFNLWRQFRGK